MTTTSNIGAESPDPTGGADASNAAAPITRPDVGEGAAVSPAVAPDISGAPLAGQALAVLATPLRVDGPAGFDPSRCRGSASIDYDPEYEAAFMLPLLSEVQRDFIVRAKPHKRDQHLSARDWYAVHCAVETGWEWPFLVWFGGMAANAGPGIKGWERTFRFNDAGLIARAALVKSRGETA